MFNKLLSNISFSTNKKFLRSANGLVSRINALKGEMINLSDGDFKTRTAALKQQLATNTLDHILPEAFALVKEASRRVLSMEHFDVQLIGGIALHHGMISEMKTGEGKTLVATLAAYINALTEQGVHVVTVNEYLAKRDAEWMGAIYRFLGLSVGCITSDMQDHEKKEIYAADIIYGTNNEFGFDYLRDNLKYSSDSMVQRGKHFAIIDEVDSILIDEARTPLIISSSTEENIGY